MDNVAEGSPQADTQPKSTLDNLAANVASQMTQQDAVSQVGTEPGLQGETQGEVSQPSAEQENSTTVDTGKQTRVEQENKLLRTVLNKLNIDPDSNKLDYLAKGYIEPTELLPQTQPVKSTEPTKSVDQILGDLENRTKEGVTENDFVELLQATKGLVGDIKNIRNESESSKLNELINSNINAVNQTFAQSDVYNKVPEDVREIAREMVLGATDINVYQLGQQIGDINRVSRPDVYAEVTGEVSKKFSTLFNRIYKAGQESALGNIQNNNRSVNPISTGTGRASPPPTQPMTLQNLQSNVDEYMAGNKLVI